MRTLLIVVTLVAMLFVPAALAQDEVADPTCTPEDWQALQDELALEVLSLVNSENPVETILRIDTILGSIRSQCTSLIFTKAEYPNGIIGPIDLDGSLYQTTLSGNGSGSVEMTDLTEGCGGYVSSIILPFEGGSETDLWEFDGVCSLMFEVSGSAEEWTLEITRLR